MDTLQLPWTGYIPHKPTPKQLAFLLLDNQEALYGGAAGGGKSDALLMAALQYINVPGYSALLLRRSYTDLSLPGALMDRAKAWLLPSGARWRDGLKTWEFPSGASITFGYLEKPGDEYRYQSTEFQFVGFDELTQFTEAQYRYLFSRLRRPYAVDVPLRMRSAGGQRREYYLSLRHQGAIGLHRPGSEGNRLQGRAGWPGEQPGRSGERAIAPRSVVRAVPGRGGGFPIRAA
jgi:hypothetical protein